MGREIVVMAIAAISVGWDETIQYGTLRLVLCRAYMPLLTLPMGGASPLDPCARCILSRRTAHHQ